MTSEQYERWRDFAQRMARTCFWGHRRPTSRWIVEMVDKWFSRFDDADDVFTIVDWDHSGPYEDGRRQTWKTYCCCDGRSKTGNINPQCPECRGSGVHFDFATGPLVCDYVTCFSYSYRCSDRCKRCRHRAWCRRCECAACERDCVCDDIEMAIYEQWDDQWGGPVRCCIRAGLDFASSPSAGVIGFTAGDLRAMWPAEGVPEWVMPPNERLHYWLSDQLNGTFAELPDTAGIVL